MKCLFHGEVASHSVKECIRANCNCRRVWFLQNYFALALWAERERFFLSCSPKILQFCSVFASAWTSANCQYSRERKQNAEDQVGDKRIEIHLLQVQTSRHCVHQEGEQAATWLFIEKNCAYKTTFRLHRTFSSSILRARTRLSIVDHALSQRIKGELRTNWPRRTIE